MATQPISNVIDPPPRLTGDAGQDTVAVIQWLNAFYVKGILSGGLLQPQNMDPSLISLGALIGAADMMAYYTAEDVFDLTGFTAFARTLLDDADAASARATLGAGTVTGVTGTAPIVSSGGTAPAISISDFVGSGLTHAAGAVPDPGAVAGTTKFLREDATFAVPPGAGDVVGPAGATGNNVVLFDGATGKLVKDGGTLGSAAYTASGAYDAAGAAAAAQAASQPADADLTTWAGVTPGTGVTTALAVNVGTAGSVVVNGGALGTPSGGTLTNASGLPAAGVTGTALVAAAIGVTVQGYDADLSTWAGITPGANVGTFLATPSSANLAAALTDETGTGGAVFANKPQFVEGIGLGATAAGAGGIAFPATAVAVADVNTLDDYQEGSWTPTLTTTGVAFTSVTYGANVGARYVKIGKLVHIQGYMATDAVTKGAATGIPRISGLPFPNATNVTGIDSRASILFSHPDGWLANHPVSGNVIGDDIYLSCQPTSNGAAAWLDVADVNTGAGQNTVYFSGCYMTD